jgi:hypothetical protein
VTKVGKKVPSQLKESLDRSRHFVSPETEQHQPTPIDLDHAVVNEGSLDGNEGRIEGSGENNFSEQSLQHTRKHEAPEEVHQGEHPNRVVKKSGVAERHVQSKPGLQVAAERKAHLQSVRAQREKENFGKK